MNDDSPPLETPRSATAADAAPTPPTSDFRWRWSSVFIAFLTLVACLALALAWRADQRVHDSERELVKRQQESAERVSDALLLARQTQETMREAGAKLALLEARFAEVSAQRGQLEDLVQSVARSRDDHLVADIESAMRAAVQQASLTGSAEPLVATLKQSDERLARAEQPRLEPVRRAIARDLDRVKAASTADGASLVLRIGEVIRMVDELPLLAAAEPRRDLTRGSNRLGVDNEPAATTALDPGLFGGWFSRALTASTRFIGDQVWPEVRSLVRITRIDRPDAMFVAPEQAFFLRENLKLRLLNARLALLARQFDSAQSDLAWSRNAIEHYFDPGSKRTQIAAEQLRQVAQQARHTGIARIDDTFAALATAGAVR